jgi:hypothetical protein
MLTRRDALRATIAALCFGTATTDWSARAQDSAQADQPRLALKGYDPVAYFTEGRPVQGKPEFEFTWGHAARFGERLEARGDIDGVPPPRMPARVRAGAAPAGHGVHPFVSRPPVKIRCRPPRAACGLGLTRRWI